MPDRSTLERHNIIQRDYFESTVKRTMIPTGTPYIRRQAERVLAFAGIAEGMTVLEIGCGMGRYTLDLLDRGFRLEGLDLSPGLLERLREFDGGRHDIPLHCTDVIDHPSELDGRFDAAIGFFALHHFHDLPGCFAAMLRFLKPGGRLVFLEPNAYNPLYYLQILLTPRMTWRGDGGVAKMRKGLLLDVLAGAGFQTPTVERFGFFPPFVTNRRLGAGLESVLERFPLWRPCLPFQLIRGERG